MYIPNRNWSELTPLLTIQCQPCTLPIIAYRLLASTIHSNVSILIVCAVVKSQCISSRVVAQSNIFWEKFSICRICRDDILSLWRQVGFIWEGKASNGFRVGSVASWMEQKRSLRTRQILLVRLKSSEWKLWISEIGWMWWHFSVMVRKEDSRMPWSTLVLDTGLKGIISEEEEKGGAMMWDCIGMVK